mgnify:CR=1 FL=1
MEYRYNTRSNKVRIVKTPGGQLRYLHLKKKGTAPKCGDCGIKLPGVSISGPTDMAVGCDFDYDAWTDEGEPAHRSA